MNEFLNSNEWQWRLARTVTQGVLGVVVTNIDLLVGTAVLDPTWRALVVALVMAAPTPRDGGGRRSHGEGGQR